MSVIRQNPATKEWVIIATERSRRPHDFAPKDLIAKKGLRGELLQRLKTCPFCPGNEAETPPALYVVPGVKGNLWQVRVFENKYAALTGSGSLERHMEGGIFRSLEGFGAHEVLVETPLHNHPLALMEAGEVETVLQAARLRYRELRTLPYVKFILIFKNHGVRAGTSLEHPHCQIVATPVAPPRVRQRYEVATAYYDDTGRCIYCDMIQDELEVGKRVIWEDSRLVVFHPFASQVPFETWIAPKQHCSCFGAITDEDLANLARVLRNTLRQLYLALGDPHYNLIVHNAPVEDEHKDYYLWHIQIIPRLTMIAGFELGSGIYINTVMPEESAEFIRNVKVSS